MAYRRILTIQDISCVGQCSMTVALPILSACGHETCILPSKLLSAHTGGFGKPAIVDLSGSMKDFSSHWQSAGIAFDAIYTGYLGSLEAIEQAKHLIRTTLAPGGKSLPTRPWRITGGSIPVLILSMPRPCGNYALMPM